ncbi:hypothetical protein ABPG74_000899 [Tetrahymena malaccensis]
MDKRYQQNSISNRENSQNLNGVQKTYSYQGEGTQQAAQNNMLQRRPPFINTAQGGQQQSLEQLNDLIRIQKKRQENYLQLIEAFRKKNSAMQGQTQFISKEQLVLFSNVRSQEIQRIQEENPLIRRFIGMKVDDPRQKMFITRFCMRVCEIYEQGNMKLKSLTLYDNDKEKQTKSFLENLHRHLQLDILELEPILNILIRNFIKNINEELEKAKQTMSSTSAVMLMNDEEEEESTTVADYLILPLPNDPEMHPDCKSILEEDEFSGLANQGNGISNLLSMQNTLGENNAQNQKKKIIKELKFTMKQQKQFFNFYEKKFFKLYDILTLDKPYTKQQISQLRVGNLDRHFYELLAKNNQIQNCLKDYIEISSSAVSARNARNNISTQSSPDILQNQYLQSPKKVSKTHQNYIKKLLNTSFFGFEQNSQGNIKNKVKRSSNQSEKTLQNQISSLAQIPYSVNILPSQTDIAQTQNTLNQLNNPAQSSNPNIQISTSTTPNILNNQNICNSNSSQQYLQIKLYSANGLLQQQNLNNQNILMPLKQNKANNSSINQLLNSESNEVNGQFNQHLKSSEDCSPIERQQHFLTDVNSQQRLLAPPIYPQQRMSNCEHRSASENTKISSQAFNYGKNFIITTAQQQQYIYTNSQFNPNRNIGASAQQAAAQCLGFNANSGITLANGGNINSTANRKIQPRSSPLKNKKVIVKEIEQNFQRENILQGMQKPVIQYSNMPAGINLNNTFSNMSAFNINNNLNNSSNQQYLNNTLNYIEARQLNNQSPDQKKFQDKTTANNNIQKNKNNSIENIENTIQNEGNVKNSSASTQIQTQQNEIYPNLNNITKVICENALEDDETTTKINQENNKTNLQVQRNKSSPSSNIAIKKGIENEKSSLVIQSSNVMRGVSNSKVVDEKESPSRNRKLVRRSSQDKKASVSPQKQMLRKGENQSKTLDNTYNSINSLSVTVENAKLNQEAQNSSQNMINITNDLSQLNCLQSPKEENYLCLKFKNSENLDENNTKASSSCQFLNKNQFKDQENQNECIEQQNEQIQQEIIKVQLENLRQSEEAKISQKNSDQIFQHQEIEVKEIQNNFSEQFKMDYVLEQQKDDKCEQESNNESDSQNGSLQNEVILKENQSQQQSSQSSTKNAQNFQNESSKNQRIIYTNPNGTQILKLQKIKNETSYYNHQNHKRVKSNQDRIRISKQKNNDQKRNEHQNSLYSQKQYNRDESEDNSQYDFDDKEFLLSKYQNSTQVNQITCQVDAHGSSSTESKQQNQIKPIPSNPSSNGNQQKQNDFSNNTNLTNFRVTSNTFVPSSYKRGVNNSNDGNNPAAYSQFRQSFHCQSSSSSHNNQQNKNNNVNNNNMSNFNNEYNINPNPNSSFNRSYYSRAKSSHENNNNNLNNNNNNTSSLSQYQVQDQLSQLPFQLNTKPKIISNFPSSYPVTAFSAQITGNVTAESTNKNKKKEIAANIQATTKPSQNNNNNNSFSLPNTKINPTAENNQSGSFSSVVNSQQSNINGQHVKQQVNQSQDRKEMQSMGNLDEFDQNYKINSLKLHSKFYKTQFKEILENFHGSQNNAYYQQEENPLIQQNYQQNAQNIFQKQSTAQNSAQKQFEKVSIPLNPNGFNSSVFQLNINQNNQYIINQNNNNPYNVNQNNPYCVNQNNPHNQNSNSNQNTINANNQSIYSGNINKKSNNNDTNCGPTIPPQQTKRSNNFMKQAAAKRKDINFPKIINPNQRDKTLKIIEDFQQTNEKSFSNLTSQKCSFDSRNIVQAINAKAAFSSQKEIYEEDINQSNKLLKGLSASKGISANPKLYQEKIAVLQNSNLQINQNLSNNRKDIDTSKRRRSESADNKCTNLKTVDVFSSQAHSVQLFKEGQNINLLNNKTEVNRSKDLKNQQKIKNSNKYFYLSEKEALKEFDDMRQQVLKTINSFQLSQQEQNNSNLQSSNRITQNIKTKYLRSSLEEKKYHQITTKLHKQNSLLHKQNEADSLIKLNNSQQIN